MAFMTVVEVAGLSGLPPDTVRELIEGGQLAARAVPSENGVAYLVESDQLQSLGFSTGRAERLLGVPQVVHATTLQEALAGLQAALARRSTKVSPGEVNTSARSGFVRRPFPRRPASGLSEAELQDLAERIDRLLPDEGWPDLTLSASA
jgi:hypothetical protein